MLNCRLFLALLWACLFLPSCSSDEEKKEEVGCTVLFYLAGRGNGLSDEVSEKIDAIAIGWGEYDGNLLILQDDETVNHPQLLQMRMVNDKKEFVVVKTYPNVTAASPQLLKQVAADVRGGFPSKRYGLVLFSHASGWLPEGTLSAPRSLLPDNEREMSLPEFAQALPDNMFRFIVFETCLMSGIEVMCELQDKADYVVASSAEICSPGFTRIYPTALKYLYLPEPDLLSYAGLYYEYWRRQNPASATISVIDVAKAGTLVSQIAAGFAADGMDASSLPEVDVSQIQRFDKLSGYSLFYDLSAYMRVLLSEKEFNKVNSAIDDCVIYEVSTPYIYNGIVVNKHCGLTAYIPQHGLPYLNKSYKETRYFKALQQK